MRLTALLFLLLLGAAPVPEALERGDAAWEGGDVATALVSWTDALEAARVAKDGPAIVEASLRLAAAHRELGRVETAARVLAEGEAAASSAAERARLAMASGQLALARGEVGRAESDLRQAFEAHRDLGDPAEAAVAALHLGMARLALGRTEQAAQAFDGAARLFDALGDVDGGADARLDLAAAALRSGDLGAARAHLELALARYRATGNHAGEADAKAALGRLFEALGRDEAAADQYREALATARARKDVPRQARLLLALGTLAARAGDDAGAAAQLRAAEEALSAAGRPAEALAPARARASLTRDPVLLRDVAARAREAGVPTVEAAAVLDLAALLRTRDPAAARQLAERGARLAADLGISELRWRSDHLRGVLALDAGQAEVGIDALESAVAELERTRGGLDVRDAEGFVLRREAPYRALVAALLARGDTTRALLYADRMQRPELPAEADRLAALDTERSWVEERLGEARDDEARDVLRRRLAELRVAFARAVDELRATHPELDSRVRVAPEDLEAIQGDLPPGVVVLQPILLDDRLVLLVLGHDRLVARTVEVDPAEVAEVAARLARTMRAGLVSMPELTLGLCDQLGAWLLAPVAEDLADARVLVVSLDGPLRQVPFSLLRHDGRFVVEDRAVVAVTHVGSLVDAPEGGLALTGEGLLLLGDPDGTLPGARAEVDAVARRFPGATVLLGDDGTLEALRESAAGKHTLHLATHGRIDPDRPDRSHLVLAGPAARLAYREIPGLAPWLTECRLVVLSACESALPVDAPAGEGPTISINGLAAQFRRAGVETLVASLWQVDDESTRVLMTRFYQHLAAGLDAAAALRAAQLEVRAHEAWAHPWYWGAFVLVGDWRQPT